VATHTKTESIPDHHLIRTGNLQEVPIIYWNLTRYRCARRPFLMLPSMPLVAQTRVTAYACSQRNSMEISKTDKFIYAT
jgi:hypothetical protein